MAHQEGVEVVHPEEKGVEAVDSDLHLVAVDRGLLQENEVFTLIMCFVNIAVSYTHLTLPTTPYV